MQLTAKFATLASSLTLLAALVAGTPVAPLRPRATTSVTFDGRTFVNKGLVGFGRISGDAKDSYGESIGGIGSAIALDSITKASDGTYVASLQAQPDRGHNTQTTTDYRARQHKFSIKFDPSQTGPQENINATYVSSLLYKLNPATFNGDGNFTTGLDPTAVRSAVAPQPALPLAPSDSHISFDTEGLALVPNSDAAWISDEYGPYIYYLNRTTGQVTYTIQPPQAITPYIGGQYNFTSSVDPNTGRAPNQGFEGLTLDRNTNTLWACLQSAVEQDGGSGGKATNRYTRLVGYNVANPANATLQYEYIVPLPQSSKGNTRATSEVHIIDATTFLILARDGNGFGDTSSDSTFKDVDLFSIKNATNIANTKYDSPANPAAPNGVLASTIKPAAYTSFVNLISKTELSKFGLQVGGAIDRTLVASKLESLALAPVGDAAFPNDYFLWVVSDNDFITTNGAQAAEASDGTYQLQSYSDPYAQQYGTADTQIFIYRVTLPGYAQSPTPN
ncbi:hypothetical protein OC834_004615 [Tilletia horrida]|uniref:Phytase-like domain-containing protein n=1 Tax=Tilletia horrida TaxID=155126 RepID=A0AAN6JPT4_9BASI|nr:hypothetical protein OC835_005741 [Tilletia horrida]KAK0526939.1 hypothetical protein OC834_004615 [Tilletia horrida]KAK0527191.1 hypothetical protein OC842_004945 [Tilletia horrida]KAK0558268.1 hypothetical protein OC844_005286 [Tilletia horrida]